MGGKTVFVKNFIKVETRPCAHTYIHTLTHIYMTAHARTHRMHKSTYQFLLFYEAEQNYNKCIYFAELFTLYAYH